jgi:hypothetical protein
MPTTRHNYGKQYTEEQRAEIKAAFLAAFRETRNPGSACEVVGISWSTIHTWKRQDPDFNLEWAEVHELINDEIRSEIYRRAVIGVPKPVFYRGVQVATVPEYSDALLQFLAKSRMPEFRDRLDLTATDMTERIALQEGLDPLELRREAERIAEASRLTISAAHNGRTNGHHDDPDDPDDHGGAA